MKRKPIWWVSVNLKLRFTFPPTKKSNYGIFQKRNDAIDCICSIMDIAHG